MNRILCNLVLTIVSGAVYFLIRDAFPWPYKAVEWLFFILSVWSAALTVSAIIPGKPRPAVVVLNGITWTMEDFVRGWLITGNTGSGKTAAGINTITSQLFQRVKNFGAVCLDQKGLYWEILVDMAAKFGRSDDLILLQVKPPDTTDDWKPKHTVNITGNPGVPTSTYAKTIVDTASSLTGKSSNPFFVTKAQLGIELAFNILRHLEYECTIPNAYDLIFKPHIADHMMKQLGRKFDPRSQELLVELRDNFLGQPAEQLGGVTATIQNYLAYFLNPEIADIFCADEPTFDIRDIDKGRIVCIAMPQKYQTERLYINTVLKLSFYFHALCRFDKPADVRKQDNLIVLFADEGQEIITGAESAFADHRAAGVIREARATIVLATQAYTSILGALEKKYADVLMLNLSNELIFQVANDDSAKIASKNIGERRKQEESWGSSGGRFNYNYKNETKPWFEPFELRAFKKFHCVIRHCEKKWKKTILPPLDSHGEIPEWYEN
ncbi:MAG: type IV secretion system DNA-binding domain-containing protein [Verrucomicrobiales bacterium]|jgi:hypothetical protein|nr:type IV secretion system DNA-binding domain-containing protein [Verrucomicrobiales bacterium]